MRPTRFFTPFFPHALKRVLNERMPVSHSDVNRKIVPVFRKKLLKFLSLLVREFVQRRFSVEDFVVKGDFPQPVLGYRSSARHIS